MVGVLVQMTSGDLLGHLFFETRVYPEVGLKRKFPAPTSEKFLFLVAKGLQVASKALDREYLERQKEVIGLSLWFQCWYFGYRLGIEWGEIPYWLIEGFRLKFD